VRFDLTRTPGRGGSIVGYSPDYSPVLEGRCCPAIALKTSRGFVLGGIDSLQWKPRSRSRRLPPRCSPGRNRLGRFGMDSHLGQSPRKVFMRDRKAGVRTQERELGQQSSCGLMSWGWLPVNHDTNMRATKDIVVGTRPWDSDSLCRSYKNVGKQGQRRCCCLRRAP